MANLFCDLAIDGRTLWSGVPCLNCVLIDTYPHLGFQGHLAFADTQGAEDPDYTGLGLGGRFALFYSPGPGQAPVQVPLQAIPSQQLDIDLGGQNCTLSVYHRVTR